jgi:hypothetical protein
VAHGRRTLQAAHDAAAPGPGRSRAAAALGQAWLQQDQAARAAPLLEQAAADGGLPPRERAAAALDLASSSAPRCSSPPLAERRLVAGPGAGRW